MNLNMLETLRAGRSAGARRKPTSWLLVATLLIGLAAPVHAADYSSAIARLGPLVQTEMTDWDIGGVAVALVDDQQIVHAAGFGEAKRDSIFRVGSISKLFNAVAVMQQVEAGKLDLDAPVPAELISLNPFPDQPAVTLRLMLSHRSGLPRESPVGGYLDNSEPGIAATVASMRPTVLVTRPGEKMRYSNIGPTIAGHLVEKTAGMGFAGYQRERVLGPLGMTSSFWLRKQLPRNRLVVSHLRVARPDGRFTRQETPVFDLGTVPAGNLFSTVDDLARFASELLAGGGRLLKPESLAEMWRPQAANSERGFGLGFVVGEFRGQRTIGHSGAVFGHSSSLVVLPDAKLAVIVLGNEDIANGRIERIGNAALSWLLEAKLGIEPGAATATMAVDQPARFTGDYESENYWARLEVRDGELVADISGQPASLRCTGPLSFVLNSRIHNESALTFEANDEGAITGFSLAGQRFGRAAVNSGPLPDHWRKVLGSYGHSFIPLIVSERHGHLYVMTENMVDYRLTPVNLNTCALPRGMYVDEEAVFLTDRRGRVHGINFAGMVFPKR